MTNLTLCLYRSVCLITSILFRPIKKWKVRSLTRKPSARDPPCNVSTKHTEAPWLGAEALTKCPSRCRKACQVGGKLCLTRLSRRDVRNEVNAIWEPIPQLLCRSWSSKWRRRPHAVKETCVTSAKSWSEDSVNPLKQAVSLKENHMLLATVLWVPNGVVFIKSHHTGHWSSLFPWWCEQQIIKCPESSVDSV